MVFGRAPKTRKKLDPDQWHLTQRCRVHGLKNVELDPLEGRSYKVQIDPIEASKKNSQEVFDNFGDEYRKFNASEYDKGRMEVTDAAVSKVVGGNEDEGSPVKASKNYDFWKNWRNSNFWEKSKKFKFLGKLRSFEFLKNRKKSNFREK